MVNQPIAIRKFKKSPKIGTSLRPVSDFTLHRWRHHRRDGLDQVKDEQELAPRCLLRQLKERAVRRALNRRFSSFFGANSNNLINRDDKNLSVALAFW